MITTNEFKNGYKDGFKDGFEAGSKHAEASRIELETAKKELEILRNALIQKISKNPPVVPGVIPYVGPSVGPWLPQNPTSTPAQPDWLKPQVTCVYDEKTSAITRNLA